MSKLEKHPGKMSKCESHWQKKERKEGVIMLYTYLDLCRCCRVGALCWDSYCVVYARRLNHLWRYLCAMKVVLHRPKLNHPKVYKQCVGLTKMIKHCIVYLFSSSSSSPPPPPPPFLYTMPTWMYVNKATIWGWHFHWVCPQMEQT